MVSIEEVSVVRGAKKGLISLIALANGDCTFQGEKRKLAVWNRPAKKIIFASRDVKSCWK
jgi:hypothetical protein